MSDQPNKTANGVEVAMQIVASLMVAVEKAGGSYDDVRELAEPAGQPLIERFARMIVEIKQGTSNLFKMMMVWSISLQDLIAAGKYDHVDEDITGDRFPFPPPRNLKKELLMELVELPMDGDIEDIVASLKERGLRPATIWELLAFGIVYPDKQREFRIAALGSVCEDSNNNNRESDRYFPVLGGGVSERTLDLYVDDCCWETDMRFLAVHDAAA